MMRFMLSLLIAISSYSVVAAPSQSYIIGSYVNVRAQPAKDADVIDRLIVNTPVTMLSQSNDWCEINWNLDRRGFVACTLLGENKIKIEDVGEKYLFDSTGRPLRDNNGYPKPHPGYSPLRAFWIEPTIERLFDAGEHFRQIALPASQLQKEDRFRSAGGYEGVPELSRFPLPEFEAMKALLSHGIVAPLSQYIPPTAESQEFYPYLSPAKTSFFKKLSDVGSFGAGTEAISAQFQIPFQMTVLSSPSWGGDNNSYPLLIGAWDIGEVEVKLVRPVHEVTVSLGGQISIDKSVIPSRNNRGDPSGYCIDHFKAGTALAIIRLASSPVLSRANVFIKKEPIPDWSSKNSSSLFSNTASRDPLEGSLSTIQVDLDNDGEFDLIIRDDGGSGMDLDYHRVRNIFANVNGQWYLLDTDEVHACGC